MVDRDYLIRQKMNFLEALEEAKYVVNKLRKNNVQVPPGSRLCQHIRVIQQAVTGFSDPKVHQLKHLGEALREIRELFVILSHDDFVRKISKKKLKDLVGGREVSTHDSNLLPRNTQYELFIASLFYNAKLHVELDEPDIRCSLNDIKFSIAVKRLKSLNKMEARIREAYNQIEKGTIPGIIALSVEAACNPDFDPVPYNHDVPRELDDFYKRHADKFTPGPRPKKLVSGVLLTFWAWALSTEGLPERSEEPITIPFQVGWHFKFIPIEYQFTKNNVLHSDSNPQIAQIVDRVLKSCSYLTL